MGEVYRARDTKLGRDVAIKVLPALLSENPDRLNRFEQEAQAAGALNHPSPKPLFRTRMLAWITNFHEFDVSPDGERFLIGTLIGETKAAPPTVILNWTSELKK
jgi:serine/threonine protein kinase